MTLNFELNGRKLAEVLTLRCWNALREDGAGARSAKDGANGDTGR